MHMEAEPNSILPRYLGLFQIRSGTEPLTFLCMTNAFGGVHAVERRYDLKGSTHNRKASVRELQKSAPVRKDNDWLDERRVLPCDEAFLTALEADVMFLARCSFIDYSLLVGVASESERPYNLQERTPGLVALRGAGGTVMYVALVDILTAYNCKKVPRG